MIAASWILVVFMMFNAPQPPEKDQDQQDGQAQQVAENPADGNTDSKADPGDADEASKKSDNPQDSESGDATKSSDASANQDASTSGETPGESGQPDQVANPDPANDQDPGDEPATDEPAGQPSSRRQLDQQFISLGSLAADSPYRFLVTLNNRAASIHRLELAQRKRNSERLRYKDLEIRHGYLGHLELSTSPAGGCRVNISGPGTPAEAAGIRAGDRITRFDGQPVETRIDLEVLLRGTRPGQEVAIEYEREGQTATASVTLSRPPLEVIRPNIVPEQAEFAFELVDMRQSFAVSVFEPVGSTWNNLGAAHDEIWEPEVGENWVKFYYPYRDEAECREAGLGYQVIKTYRITEVPTEEINDVTSMNYHLDFDVELKNLGDQPRSFAYRVDGPNGLPTEDWWFAIKIHGEWSAVFTQAGARDLVASTIAKSFHFIGGPKIYKNGTDKNQRDPIYVIDPGNDNPNAHQLNYIGVDSHYFVSALIPSNENGIAPREAYSAYAMPQYVQLARKGDEKSVNAQRKKEAGWYQKLVPVNFKAYFIFEKPKVDDPSARQLLEPGESLTHSFMIFAGPKEPGLLKKYEIDDAVTFGWFAAFSWPLVNLLHLFYAIVGNYGIAIVLLTVLVRLAMMRFSRKMVLNTQMMQLLAPEIKAIAEKYKDDFQAKSRAQQELFRKYNYNPFSGCLVMLIQLPVFIGLYRGLSVDIALRDQPLIPGIDWCSNLAGPDQLWRWQDDLPSFFSFLTHETGWLGPYFNLLPIISVVLMLIQQKLFTPPPTDDQQAMMQKMMTFMMVFIGVIFFKVPAGLCIYFITSTLWAIAEKKLIPPPKLPDHLQTRLDQLKELQAKEKADGVEPGTYTNVTTTAGGNATRKHTERARKKTQKNRRK